MLGLHENPKRRPAGPARTPAGNSRRAYSPHVALRSAAWAGHRACYPGDLRRRAAGRPRRAVSGAAAAGGAEMDHPQVGNVGQQSEGAFLLLDQSWTRAARTAIKPLEA